MTATTATPVSTTIKKDHWDQWIATSYFPLNDGRHLRVSTSKSSNRRLYTSMQAVKIGSSNGFTSESFAMFTDFHGTVMSFPDVKMVTEKKITECHNKALEAIQPHLDAANEFYKTNTVVDY